MARKTGIITCILFCIVWICALGQSYNFRQVSLSDGLPQTQSEVVFEDSRGFLWIGLYEGGLSRYDGYDYTTYTMADGLVYNSIKDINETSSGHLIIGTGQGISLFDGREFRTLIKNIIVNEIEVDKNDNIWVGAREGLIMIPSSANYNPIYYKSLKGRHLRTLLLDHNSESLWAGGFDSLYHLPAKNTLDNKAGYESIALPGSVSVEVQDLNFGPDGVLWVALLNHGVYTYDNKEFNAPLSGDLKLHQPHQIEIGPDSSLWIATYFNGLYQWEDGKLFNYNQGNGLLNNHVRNLSFTSEGEAWVSTSAGINRFTGKLFSHVTKEQGLANNLVWDVEKFEDRLYIMHFDGISYLEDGKVVNLDNHGFSADGGADLLMLENFLLAGSLSGIYLCKNPGYDEPVFIKYSLFPNSTFHYLLRSADKKTIYAIRNSFHLVSFSWDNETGDLSDPRQLTAFKEEINDFWEDDGGRLWVAHDLGLTLVDPKSGERNEVISGMPVNQIVRLSENQMALATSGHGLVLVDVQQWMPLVHEQTQIDKKTGLASDNIYSLQPAEKGVLWIGTDNGINKFSYNTGERATIRHYSGSEGFTALEANHKAVTRDTDGNIWWGTIGGIIKYTPQYDTKTQPSPDNIILTGLDLFYKSVDWKEYVNNTLGWFELPEDLTLPHDQNHLTFHFTTTQLAGSKRVRYSHRLEGLEEEWSPPTLNREAVYANIPPGDYRFQVRATVDGLNWTQDPVTFPFIIRQPFYTTWWFITAALLTFILAGFVVVRHQLGQVKASRDLLARKVRQRTAEIEKQREILAIKHDELEVKSSSLQNALNELSSKNFQITSSISYAKRIQEAILPREDELVKELKDVLIFYRPRDIVSGDFYWVARRDNLIYLAVVDCTGHGVPGAFMSMIGYNLLQTALDTELAPGPVEILEHMDREVMRILKQDDLDRKTQDGMDVALLMIDKSSNTVTYAGAKRPLYMVCDGKLQVLKGGRNPVGGSLEPEPKTYRGHAINYTPGCMVYLSTDGFADQFGGQSDKKFMIGRLKKLLARISGLPSDKQHEAISSAFDEWKGNYDQTDDVLVVGIRLP